MPLEFPCYRCGQKITLPDDLPEQMIPCPHCGVLIAHGGTDSAGQARTNYAANQDQFWKVSSSEPKISALNFSSVFENAWDIGMKRWQPLLLLGVIAGVLNMIIISIISFPFVILFYLGLFMFVPKDSNFSYNVYEPPCMVAQNIVENDNAGIVMAAAERPENLEVFLMALVFGGLFVLLLSLVASVVYCWIYAGEILLTLSIARGEEAPLSLLFGGWKYLWQIILVCANRTILYMLVWFVITLISIFPVIYYIASLGPNGEPSAMGVIFILLGSVLGMTLMVICSLYISAIFALSEYFVIDRNQGAIEAMRSSYIFVIPHFWKVLGAFLLMMIILAVVSSIPLVGFFLVAPVMFLFWVVLYLKITGQKNCLAPEATPGTQTAPTLP